jgi:hypothetical protein
MSNFAVPSEYQEEMKGSMSDNSGIKLPFPAPTLYWFNGKTDFKDVAEIKDPRRFGGWGVSKEDLDTLGVQPSPAWVLHNLTNKEGKSYQAYLFRSAWVAPIARRSAWFENDGRARSSLNILAYLALRNKEGKFLPYGPVVLSAKSFTGLAIEKCFKDFGVKTADVRGETLPNFFFTPIGTYGDEPKFSSNKGKSGKESSVTDPQLYVPANGYDEAFLQSVFVPNIGSEILADMANYKRQAKEWLADWNDRKGKTAEAQPVTQESAEEYPEFPA